MSDVTDINALIERVVAAVVDASNIVTCGGYYEIDIEAAEKAVEPILRTLAERDQAAEQRGADRAFEEAAGIAEVYSSIHVEKRDDALADKNMEGALTKARQAQTCDEIAAAIRQRIGSPK